MTRYPDIERQVAEWAKARFGVQGGSQTPSDLELRLPFVRVSKLGGSRDDVTDHPTVDIDVFASSRDAALALAEDIDTALKPRTRLTPGGAIIDSVGTRVSPRLLPWDNSKIRRYGATYTLGLRR